MDSSCQPRKLNFLDLPREIRDQIIGELFFPKDAVSPIYPQRVSTQVPFARAKTTPRSIFPYQDSGLSGGCIYPYRKRFDSTNFYDVAIIRTCTQLQHEAEYILYTTSSWNLMHPRWSCITDESYDFLQSLPKRLRRLIGRVEMKCPTPKSKSYYHFIPLFDWTVCMTFLARECPGLQSLILWAPAHPSDVSTAIELCKKDAEWVQALLQIKSLRFFDIPMMRSDIADEGGEVRDISCELSWLQDTLTQRRNVNADRSSRSSGTCESRHTDSMTARCEPVSKPFPFLLLPRHIRSRIYSEVLLPPDNALHPYVKPWYDQTTINLLPLFLTCRQVHLEAQTLFFAEGAFPCVAERYRTALNRFLKQKVDVEIRGARTRIPRGHVRFRERVGKERLEKSFKKTIQYQAS